MTRYKKKENPTFILMIKIVLLGAGNVGINLYKALCNQQHIELIQWYNRSKTAFNGINSRVETTTQLDEIVEADLYLICVSDTALPSVSDVLLEKKGTIAHTAGSIPMATLNKHQHHGVFYPLQTFSKQKEVDFSKIPLCLEASSEQDLALLETVANALKGPIHFINSAQRKALHIAAVFVNNFTNHLYSIGEELCQEFNVPFEVLQPLIAETADKIKHLPPSQSQTGPAARGDQKILDEHLQHLTQQSHQKLYQIISAAIQKQHE